MSSFKRMRLVDESTSGDGENLSKIAKYEIQPELHRMNDLDLEMKNILSQNIDEVSKAKLYSQTLRKFMNYKRQYLRDLFAESKQLVQEDKVKPKTTKKKRTKETLEERPKYRTIVKEKDKKKIEKLDKSAVKKEEKNAKNNFEVINLDEYLSADSDTEHPIINWEKYEFNRRNA